MIGKLFEAGADVFASLMSHPGRGPVRNGVQVIAAVEAKYRRPIGILADLQGPKLRVGAFSGEGAMLKRGQTFTLDRQRGGRRQARAPAPSGDPPRSSRAHDGPDRRRSASPTGEEVKKGRAVTMVEVAGKISNRKA